VEVSSSCLADINVTSKENEKISNHASLAADFHQMPVHDYYSCCSGLHRNYLIKLFNLAEDSRVTVFNGSV